MKKEELKQMIQSEAKKWESAEEEFDEMIEYDIYFSIFQYCLDNEISIEEYDLSQLLNLDYNKEIFEYDVFLEIHKKVNEEPAGSHKYHKDLVELLNFYSDTFWPGWNDEATTDQ